MEKKLIVSGFHRSATSATAHYLSNAGLSFGSDLLLPHFSNSKGHFEDKKVIQLHNNQLNKHGTTWQFHDECQLVDDAKFLTHYIDSRNGSGDWAVKDPRICLFLDQWHQATGETGIFLFVIRHWSSCIESLLNRHSGMLALKMPQPKIHDTNMQFWIQPDLAARMWLANCVRIVEFAEKNPDKSLIISQRALFGGCPIIEKLNTKYQFDLDSNAEVPFEIALLRDKANSTIFDQLSNGFQQKMNDVWEKLLSLATYRSEDESPHLYSIESHKYKTVFETISSKIANHCSDADSVEASNSDWMNKVVQCNSEDALEILQQTDPTLLREKRSFPTLKILVEKFPSDANVQATLGRLFYLMGEIDLAIKCLKKASLLDYQFAWIYKILADIYRNRDQLDYAESFAQKAIKINPNNADFYISIAKIEHLKGNTTKAETYYKKAIDKAKHSTPVLAAFGEFLEEQSREQEALEYLQRIRDKSWPIIESIARLRMTTGVDQNWEYISEILKTRNKDRKVDWLACASQLISNNLSEKDLWERCLGHWGDD